MADDQELQKWLINREAAQRAHDQHYSEHRALFDSVIQFGLEAVRSATLINGGAVVASLAFVGAVWKSNPLLGEALLYPAFIFSIGAILCGVAAGFCYFAEFLYMQGFDTVTLHYDFPYSSPKAEQAPLLRWAKILHIAAIIFILSGYLAIGCGVWETWSILHAVPAAH